VTLPAAPRRPPLSDHHSTLAVAKGNRSRCDQAKFRHFFGVSFDFFRYARAPAH